MSVKESRNWLPNQQVTIPDVKALDSSVMYDFASLLKCFQDNTPYILRGFKIPFTSMKSSLELVVSDSIAWMPDQSAGAYLKVDAGAANESLLSGNTKVIGSLADGAINYISLRFIRAADASTADVVNQWDQDSLSEFTVTAPRGLVLNYEIIINQTDFGTNAPIAKIAINSSGLVTSIQNCKQGMFRLGTGGANPDINYSSSLIDQASNNLTSTSISDPDPFAGGDWDITTFKSWMDVVMSLFKKMSGSSNWLTQTPVSNLNLLNVFNDSSANVITGQGKFQQGAAGQLSWTSDVYIRSIIGPRYYVIPANTATLADRQVGYIQLVRNNDFDPTNTYTFSPSTQTITGVLTIPSGSIIAGDWIKAVDHGDNAWRQVKVVSGNTITLYSSSDAYPNNQPDYPTAVSGVKALKSTGSYTIQVADPANVPNDADVFWMVKRDDNAFTTLTVSNVARSGGVSTLTTSIPHSLHAGQLVAITGISTDTYFNINAQIVSVTSNTLTYINNGPDVASVAASGSVSYLARMYLRGIGEINQGEAVAINDTVPENILTYIGAAVDTQTNPIYGGVASGSLDLPNYNSLAGESLTARLSKVTAMLADESQNFNIAIDLGAVTWESNVVSITGASLSIPGTTVGAAAVAINTVPSQALTDGQCLFCDINRTNGSSISVSAPTLLSALTPSQQRLVLVRRIGSNLLMRSE
jgi:hypothetical protein